jgi:hypothetical protein
MGNLDTTADIAAKPFRLVDIASRLHVSDFEAPASLPHLPELICEIFDLQSHPQERYDRWYQKSLLRCRSFEIISPRTGNRIRSGESLIVDTTIFYRFPSNPDLLLVVPCETIGEGYSIVGIVCLASRLIYRLGDPTWGLRPASVEHLESVLREPQWRTVREAHEVRVITGDWNFAHHAWNQLGALEKFGQTVDPDSSITIETTHQPLGPLAELLPELAVLRIIPKDWSAMSENKPGRVDVFLGGTVVTKAIRDRVHKVAIKRASQQWRETAERLVNRHAPIVWISVRTLNRTAVNQHEALTCLCKRLFTIYSRCAIILDGYSLPDDFSTNASYRNRKSQNQIIARDMAAASAIAGAIGRPAEAQDLVVAVGLNLLESILLAHAADFYVCHHGTVQHKIGWLAAKPGVVHTNLRALRLNPGEWNSGRMDEPPEIFYIPEMLVRESGEEFAATERERSGLFDNYEFVNIDQFADFVVTKLERLGQPPGS